MRTLLVLLAMTGAASAYDLPISRDADYCGDGLIVSASSVSGEDFTCTASAPAASDGRVALTCVNEAVSEEPPYALDATIIENHTAGTVSYSDQDGAITLRRCE